MRCAQGQRYPAGTAALRMLLVSPIVNPPINGYIANHVPSGSPVVPNQQARVPTGASSQVTGLVVLDVVSPFFMQAARAVEREGARRARSHPLQLRKRRRPGDRTPPHPDRPAGISRAQPGGRQSVAHPARCSRSPVGRCKAAGRSLTHFEVSANGEFLITMQVEASSSVLTNALMTRDASVPRGR